MHILRWIYSLTLGMALGFAIQADARPLRECVNLLAIKIPYVNRGVQVGLLFGLNKNGELNQFRSRIQSLADRPLVTWFEFEKHGLMKNNFQLMFSDKLGNALESARARNSSGAFIFFVLDGLDLGKVWSSHGFTNSEIRYLFNHPEYLDYVRWFLNGEEVDGRILLDPYLSNTGP